MKGKRIAVYGRVSTDAQNHASQLREVRAYVRRRWPKSEVIEFLDKSSGARFTREGLDALMDEVRKGRIDVFAVYKLDRLVAVCSTLRSSSASLKHTGPHLLRRRKGSTRVRAIRQVVYKCMFWRRWLSLSEA